MSSHEAHGRTRWNLGGLVQTMMGTHSRGTAHSKSPLRDSAQVVFFSPWIHFLCNVVERVLGVATTTWLTAAQATL